MLSVYILKQSAMVQEDEPPVPERKSQYGMGYAKDRQGFLELRDPSPFWLSLFFGSVSEVLDSKAVRQWLACMIEYLLPCPVC